MLICARHPPLRPKRIRAPKYSFSVCKRGCLFLLPPESSDWIPSRLPLVSGGILSPLLVVTAEGFFYADLEVHMHPTRGPGGSSM
ncbi:hypothetical protein BDV11DRAFT_187482, partial [Aspergillus similis]